MTFAGGAKEFPSPAQETKVHSRFDIERTFRIPHPFQAERHHARRCQGYEMARHNHARVAEGASITLFASALDDGDAVALASTVIGRAKTNYAAADDQHVLGHPH